MYVPISFHAKTGIQLKYFPSLPCVYLYVYL